MQELNLELFESEKINSYDFEHDEEIINALKSSYDDNNTDEHDESTDESDSIVIPKNYNVTTDLNNQELVEKIQDGVNEKYYLDLLIRKNMKLIHKVCHQCTVRIPHEDKVQIAAVAMIAASRKFDSSRGYNFSTYVVRAMNMHLYNYGSAQRRQISVPSGTSINMINVKRFVERYTSVHGRAPSDELIMSECKVSSKLIKTVKTYSEHCVAIVTSSDDEVCTGVSSEVITGSGKDYHLDESSFIGDCSQLVEKILDLLDESERVLIGLVHGVDGYSAHSFEQIASGGWINQKGVMIHNKRSIRYEYDKIIARVRNHAKTGRITNEVR